MPSSTDPTPVRFFTIRGHPVVLDTDLARLYGASTKRFNEAFKRNRHRFPDDFAFQLTREEAENLRSQIATSSFDAPANPSNEANRSQSVASSSGHGGRRYSPWVFSEHGALMAANILRSKRAVIDKTLIEHDSALQILWSRLKPLLTPPPDPPKRKIGFHA